MGLRTKLDRWAMLGVAMSTQVAGTALLNAAPFLIPYLHLVEGLSLVEAGFVAAAPQVGTMLTLIAWGVVVDRVGERVALLTGMALMSLAAFAAAFSTSPALLGVFLLLAGAAGAANNSASGRLVIGWFPPERRGFAMGIRQTAQPLGTGVAALTVPALVAAAGLREALLVPATLCAVSFALTTLLLVDPPRPTRAQARDLGQLDNPYRRDGRLWRVHLASMLLVIPQFTVWTFALVWLIDEKGWSSIAAGALVAVLQVLGAAARIGAGVWSDRAGSRLRPMRVIAALAALTMLALGLLDGTPLAIALMTIASVVSVADNGLAFTSVAEIAGPYWSGRAMGTQNTGQFLFAAAVPPAVGALITGSGYGAAFAIVAVAPLLAIPLVPVRHEHGTSRTPRVPSG